MIFFETPDHFLSGSRKEILLPGSGKLFPAENLIFRKKRDTIPSGKHTCAQNGNADKINGCEFLRKIGNEETMEDGLFTQLTDRPLADRLRPETLDDIVGQEELIGPGGPIRKMLETKKISSFILWGPPGCGKTTIARLMANGTDMRFVALSAVFSGIADLRKAFDEAEKRFSQAVPVSV